MSFFDPEAAVHLLNGAALVGFVALVLVGFASLTRHLVLYVRTKTPIDVLLKRDLGLFAGLAFIGLEAVVLRALGIVPTELESWWRFFYVLQANAIIFTPLAYWVLVELRDVEDAKKW